MSIDGRFGWLCLLASLTALPAQAEKPISAIDWLARGLLSQSATADLIQLLKDEPADMPPALQELFYTLLLTEADALRDAGASGRFLLARVDPDYS